MGLLVLPGAEGFMGGHFIFFFGLVRLVNSLQGTNANARDRRNALLILLCGASLKALSLSLSVLKRLDLRLLLPSLGVSAVCVFLLALLATKTQFGRKVQIQSDSKD